MTRPSSGHWGKLPPPFTPAPIVILSSVLNFRPLVLDPRMREVMRRIEEERKGRRSIV